MNKLVIAEKPSVAMALAKVLGATQKKDGYVEGNGYLVSWCVGHLVGLAEPEVYNDSYKKWKKENLPILPEEWIWEVAGDKKKQFKILKELMCRSDVESLICATDAGREGELIFRLVYHQCGCRKPFERLWISSMEDSAIREGFANLKPSTEYDALYEAALCRERADWIVGINATRLFSVLYGQTLNVGRVMTPTLGMVVMREAAISAFRSEPFYTIQIDFPEFAATSERMKEKTGAEELLKKCQEDKIAIVTKVEQKDKQEKAPALYDLTSLQRDANRVLGFTVQQTLDYTQSLYEKKLVTYPRTDSRYLTSDMAEGLEELVVKVADLLGQRERFAANADQVINNKKVSDHHAIIPTQSTVNADLQELPSGERAVLQLIAIRLLVSVSQAYRYAETTLELTCGDNVYTAKGKAIQEEGWKKTEALFHPDCKSKEEKNLPVIAKGDVLSIKNAEIKEGKTTPPKHFTDVIHFESREWKNFRRKGAG